MSPFACRESSSCHGFPRTRRYVIETSTDLGQTDDWEKSILDPDTFGADDASTTTRNTQNPAADARFFRIKPVIPLQP